MLAAAGLMSVDITRPSTNSRPFPIREAPAISELPSGSKLVSNDSDSADTNSPQTRWRGSRPRSNNKTRTPAFAAAIAAALPAGPPPITTRSNTLIPLRPTDVLPNDNPHPKQIMARNLYRGFGVP